MQVDAIMFRLINPRKVLQPPCNMVALGTQAVAGARWRTQTPLLVCPKLAETIPCVLITATLNVTRAGGMPTLPNALSTELPLLTDGKRSLRRTPNVLSSVSSGPFYVASDDTCLKHLRQEKCTALQ